MTDHTDAPELDDLTAVLRFAQILAMFCAAFTCAAIGIGSIYYVLQSCQ